MVWMAFRPPGKGLSIQKGRLLNVRQVFQSNFRFPADAS